MKAVITDAECLRTGVCGCAHFLDCGTRDGASALADAALARREEVVRAWRAELSAMGQPESLAWPPATLVHVFELLRIGDTPLIAQAILAAARAARDAGVPFQSAVLATQTLPAALSAVLASGAADRAALEVAARRLAWLLANLVGLAYGASDARPSLATRADSASFYGLTGVSQVMRQLYGKVEHAARSQGPILVLGESGVGKEVVARAIHRSSTSPADRFVAVNCAALPRDLVEGELFGHRRGAFSGAASDQLGLIRAADGGTFFLDEITELAMEAQAKLLRVIQERTVRPLGDVHEHPVQVRIVAATNRPLTEALEAGALRRDLYYRLQRITLTVPPLRERLSDLPLLASELAERWREESGAPTSKAFAEDAVERLCAHEWPGNVRELENVVFAACTNASGPLVHASDLPELSPIGADPEPPPATMREAERVAVMRALERSSGNKSLAARILGVSRKQLYAKIRLYGLES